MVELVVRLVFSLAIVVGMLILLTRFSAKRFRGGSNALVRVVHRQPLSRSSAIAVITVGSRVLVVGTTEHQVRLLTELAPEELGAEAEEDEYDVALEELVVGGSRLQVEPEDEFVEIPSLVEVRGATPSVVEVPSVTPSVVDVRGATPSVVEVRGATPSVVEVPSVTPSVVEVRGASRASKRAAVRASRSQESALAGSVLSAQTWKQAFAAATRKGQEAS